MGLWAFNQDMGEDSSPGAHIATYAEAGRMGNQLPPVLPSCNSKSVHLIRRLSYMANYY